MQQLELAGLRTRILVVDDEQMALLVIPEALEEGLEELGWTDLVIDTSDSGEAALATQGEIDLLVTDVVMPGIDGIETFAQLKVRWPDMACVVMTAQAPEHSTPIRALRLGAADYVSKPINPDYLVETCHRQLVVHHLRRQVTRNKLLLESIVESVGDGVVALDGDTVLLANSAATAILGDKVAAKVAELGLGAARPGAKDTSKRVLAAARVTGEDGKEHSLSVVGSPVVDSAGTRLGEVLVMRDITPALEKRAMESFKQMAAIAAHEMKNSVTGLSLVTEHLVARLSSGKLQMEETERMARLILDSIARLDRFARSFLGFSRIPDPKPMLTAPNDLVREALSLYSQQKGLPDGITVATELADDLPVVGADRDLMFQVIQNLILNACEAMENNSGSHIVLSTSADKNGVRISIQDQGCGVELDMQEAIFEPNITTREAGSGLGLVVVRDIIHKHGGRVVLTSAPGEGARFDLLLPAADPADRA